MMTACVLAVLAPLERVPPDDLAEPAVFFIEQGQLAFLELPEELVPGDLDQTAVFGLRSVREHDPDDADIAAAMGPINRRGFAALWFGPPPDLFVIDCRVRHL